jgi:RNase adaptor protein for sRNA GlmZ degradation
MKLIESWLRYLSKEKQKQLTLALGLGGINKPSIDIASGLSSYDVLFKNGWLI